MCRLPNRAGLVQNNVVQGSRKNDTDQYIGRVDHTFGNATQFFARYVHNAIENHSPTNNPNFFGSDNNRDGNLSTQFTHTFGSSLVFEARFGYNRFEQIVNQNRAFTTPEHRGGHPPDLGCGDRSRRLECAGVHRAGLWRA